VSTQEIASCGGKARPGTGWKACATTIFQSYAWNEIAARVFAGAERPYVVVAESDSGAAIIPGCVRKDSVSLLGEELFDYRDVIATGDESLTETAWEKLFEWQKPIEVKAVRGERAWAEMRPFAGAPYRPASVRLERHNKLERSLRLMAKRGCVSGHRAIGPSGDQMQIPRRCAPRNDKSTESDVVRRMYEMKTQQQSGSLFHDPLRIEAVVEMATSAPTEVFTIEHEGTLVAAVLTFLDGKICRFYGTYYDERWAKYSPGASLLYRVIQQAQARGLDFDFMTGEQAYKMRFASEVVPLWIAHVPVADRIAA
jgi:hypothetical protein